MMEIHHEHNPVSHGVSVLANTIKYVSIKHPLQFYGIPGIIANYALE